MCERKLFKESKDGLCVMCHMSLCQEEAIDCERCKNICETLINWVKETDKQKGRKK